MLVLRYLRAGTKVSQSWHERPRTQQQLALCVVQLGLGAQQRGDAVDNHKADLVLDDRIWQRLPEHTDAVSSYELCSR